MECARVKSIALKFIPYGEQTPMVFMPTALITQLTNNVAIT
jgi:hypothetical protein